MLMDWILDDSIRGPPLNYAFEEMDLQLSSQII